jgi:hypothetical protein
MTGWDTRPIAENVLGSFKNFLPKNAEYGYVVNATSDQLARHVRAGVEFIRDHPSQCQERLGLIYSWNECSEVGMYWLPRWETRKVICSRRSER